MSTTFTAFNRSEALENITHHVDDALSTHFQDSTERTVLVCWEGQGEPAIVAVNSYLPDCRCDEEEAEELARDLLQELNWFEEEGERPADQIV
jgi:hypothetical protein